MPRQDSLIVLLKTVHQALRAELDAALRDVGHGLAHQSVMVSLLVAPGASNAELARAAFVSPQSMNDILGTLLEAGFVTRKPDPDNARILRTSLTARGVAAVKRAGAELAKVEARLACALSAAEQQQLQDLLRRTLATLTRPT